MQAALRCSNGIAKCAASECASCHPASPPITFSTERQRNGRGGAVTGGRGVAARTLGMLGTILEYARHPLKLIKENPARGLKKPSEGRQRRFLSLEEIAKLGTVMRQGDTIGANDSGVAAIRLLLMTGLRRMEALTLPRDWI